MSWGRAEAELRPISNRRERVEGTSAVQTIIGRREGTFQNP